MKVLFITQDDPFYVREFFDELADQGSGDIEIAGVDIAPPMNKKSVTALARQMLDFYGPVDFVRMGIRFVVGRIGTKLPASLRGGRSFSVEQVAERAGWPVDYVKNVNDPAYVDSVKRRAIDVIVSVAAPQIFKLPLIESPRLGCINIHNAKLPQYKGMLPNFWQMYHGNRAVGVTVHRIDETIDGGEILLQDETAILPGESLDSLIRRTKRAGVGFILRVLEQLRSGTTQPISVTGEESSYFTFPTRKDVVEFRKRGYKLI